MRPSAADLRNLAGVHLAANGLLLWLGYYWLGVGETRTLTLIWSAGLALFVAGAACLLHATSFNCFRGAAVGEAFRKSLRHLLPVLVAAAAVVVLYALIARWATAARGGEIKIASYLTLKLRKPVKPASIFRVFDVLFWLVRWMVLPVFLLPLLSGVAGRGWAGFGEIGLRARSGRFWIAAPALLVCAFWAPLRILGWAPHLSSFTLELISFTARLLAAYLLFVGSCLLVELYTAAGKLRLRETQAAVVR